MSTRSAPRSSSPRAVFDLPPEEPAVLTDAPGPESTRRRRLTVGLATGGVVAAGVLLRLHTTSELWLDEALTVNIARVPLRRLPEMLRHDGAPPLYYLLLKGWTNVFGTGNHAVRLLSAVFSIAALPLAWAAGRRLGGRACAWASLLFFASSPFAVRYATEARMYALVQFLVLAGYLALRRALDRPTVGRLACLALVAGLLPLVHYWGLYLLATVGGLLLVVAVRGERRREARQALFAMAAGGALFAPWLPSFLYQSANTGAPWGRPPSPLPAGLAALGEFAGGPRVAGMALTIMLQVLLALAVFGRGVDRTRIELDLRTRREALPEAAVAAGTMVLGLFVSVVVGTAFATRYASVVFPLVLLLAAIGTARFLWPAMRHAVIAVAVGLGLAASLLNVVSERTQAGQAARSIARLGQPGDIVVYCPDQLGPAVNRLLPAGFTELPFPAGDPRFVDWVGYAKRNKASKPLEFAGRVDDLAANNTIWLVWSNGYRTYGTKCGQLSDELARLRPGAKVVFQPHSRFFERMNLTRYPPLELTYLDD